MQKINFTLILVLFVNLGYSQIPLIKQWDKRFGGLADEGLTVFQQTTDGGFILGGSSVSDSNGDKTQLNWDTAFYNTPDYWIIKIDSLGIKQWDKTFGGTSWDDLYTLQQTSDGGYILGGASNSRISGNKTQDNWDTINGTYDYWIIKVDSNGNFQWDKTFGGTEFERLYSVLQTPDGGYILGGISNSGIGGDKTQPAWGSLDYWILKTDPLGNKQWDKRFGGAGEDFLYSLQFTNDGGYILGGYSNSGNSGDNSQLTYGFNDYWIIKVDSLGNIQWDKNFGGTGDDNLYFIQKTTDNGFILGGCSVSSISGNKTVPNWDTIVPFTFDYWIIKTDSVGIKQWEKDFGGTYVDEDFGNIFQTDDGGYILAGTSYSTLSGDKTENNLGVEQTWVIKTDSFGNKQWDKTLLTTGHDESGFAIQTIDGCFAMANATDGGISGDKTQPAWNNRPDYWIIKFCDTTSTTSLTQFSYSVLSFSISPNPAQNIITITLNKGKNIIIFNLLGEIMMEKIIPLFSNKKVELDISFLSSGIYFIKVDNEVLKFVKE